MESPKITEAMTVKVIVPLATAGTVGYAAYAISHRSPEVVAVAAAGFVTWLLMR